MTDWIKKLFKLGNAGTAMAENRLLAGGQKVRKLIQGFRGQKVRKLRHAFEIRLILVEGSHSVADAIIRHMQNNDILRDGFDAGLYIFA